MLSLSLSLSLCRPIDWSLNGGKRVWPPCFAFDGLDGSRPCLGTHRAVPELTPEQNKLTPVQAFRIVGIYAVKLVAP